jgi:hypothetical protein
LVHCKCSFFFPFRAFLLDAWIEKDICMQRRGTLRVVLQ